MFDGLPDVGDNVNICKRFGNLEMRVVNKSAVSLAFVAYTRNSHRINKRIVTRGHSGCNCR